MLTYYSKKKLRYMFIAFGALLFHLFGGFSHLFSKDFDDDFDYPYEGNVKFLVDQMVNGAQFDPINTYYFKYKTNCSHLCNGPVKLLFIIKSAPENYAQRDVIRKTWGSGNNVNEKIRAVFLVGERTSETESLLKESIRYNDLVQGNFSDTYFNNTIKTMMGFKWACEFCFKHTEYFMFVDDDYYVSPKNVLKFVENPFIYPGRDVRVEKYSFTDFGTDKFELYAGYVFHSSPFRSYFSKWSVSLQEYPYNKWPPYVTAGSYVLSRLSLMRMYYASLFTQHFRFDDIYVGILAYKLEIEPIHNQNFHFDKKPYNHDYHQTIASHGYNDPEELWRVWNEENP
ncbi:hypothetical protein HHI36_014330 [Cryptolaemus montrouzieri]|uniref:Hexosyltransferase n=1 Tax=Cryptolaemus montrouzieri TaxID=559131 RepID=A0ABD2N3I2_9CUCU